MMKGEPRVTPLPESDWTPETREFLERLRTGGRVYNIFATLARHPKLLERWMVFARHILRQSTLPARQREIVILRTGFLCKAEYEWGHHVQIAKDAGLTADDIDRIAGGPNAAGWDPFEAALVKSVDELHESSSMSDETWNVLSGHLSTEQLMDLVFTVGEYQLVSMALNTLGVQLEPGFDGFTKREPGNSTFLTSPS